MRSFISWHYRDRLTRHGLNTFAGFWNLPFDWVEDRNVRHQGWSGTSRHTLVDGEASSLSIFVKRQENHNYRSLLHLLEGRPTLFREFSMIRRMEQIGVPTAEPVFYDECRDGGVQMAVLATVALDGYRELNRVFQDSSLETSVRQVILHRVADAVRLIHHHGLQHNRLTGRHVMVRLGEDKSVDIRILDLEQMRRDWRRVRTTVCDIETFIRHATILTSAERAELVCQYTRSLSPAHRKKLVARINRRIVRRWRVKDGTAPVIHLND